MSGEVPLISARHKNLTAIKAATNVSQEGRNFGGEVSGGRGSWCLSRGLSRTFNGSFGASVESRLQITKIMGASRALARMRPSVAVHEHTDLTQKGLALQFLFKW